MIKIAIVGISAGRYSDRQESEIRKRIAFILKEYAEPVLVSGHSPKGGVDIFAEEIFRGLYPEVEPIIYPANKDHEHWHCSLSCQGYRYRNGLIAENCDELYCITVKDESEYCYHCQTVGHKRNGGCWTMQIARLLNKPGELVIIE